MKTVREQMTRDVVTVEPQDPLRKVVEMVMVRRIRHIPVVVDEGVLSGIVTDRDVKRVLPSPLDPPPREAYESLLDDTLVGRIMTREPFTVQADATVAEAVALMLEKKVGGLPVVEGGRLVGMFTQSDALRGYLELLRRS